VYSYIKTIGYIILIPLTLYFNSFGRYIACFRHGIKKKKKVNATFYPILLPFFPLRIASLYVAFFFIIRNCMFISHIILRKINKFE